MKKTIVDIFLVLLSLNAFGQNGDYLFKYEVIIDYNKQKNVILIDTIERINNLGIKIVITDFEDRKLSNAVIKLVAEGKSENIIADEEGCFDISENLKEGEVQISYVGLKTQTINFKSIKNKTLQYKVKLAEEHLEPTIYEIHSKRSLNKTELERIKNCLEKKDTLKLCKNDDYNIMIQI